MLSCYFFMAVSLAVAQEPTQITPRIYDFGIYSPDTASPDLINQIDQIPATVGTVFGVRIMFDSQSTSSYSFRWVFPEMQNPEDGRIWTEMSGSVELAGDTMYPVFARINHAWEAVPGDWIVQILDGDDVVVEKLFRVSTSPVKDN
jgi:hypothetical protein